MPPAISRSPASEGVGKKPGPAHALSEGDALPSRPPSHRKSVKLAVSTRWNAQRHKAGQSLIEEILALGISHAELGYDLTADLVPGVLRLVQSGAVTITSVHHVCPVPLGFSMPHPELFLLSSSDRRERDRAVRYLLRTIEVAAEMRATAVVIHAGRVEMAPLTPRLLTMRERGEAESPAYEKTRMRLITQREKRARRHLDWLRAGLESVVPALQACQVRLALENLPTWESLPAEHEVAAVCGGFQPWVAYWHDLGHAHVREQLGFIAHRHWLKQLTPWLAGFHVHDVKGVSWDHLPPGQGEMDFALFTEYVRADSIVVVEVLPGTPTDELQAGLQYIRTLWQRPHRDSDGEALWPKGR